MKVLVFIAPHTSKKVAKRVALSLGFSVDRLDKGQRQPMVLLATNALFSPSQSLLGKDE